MKIFYKLIPPLVTLLYLTSCADGEGRFRTETIGNAKRSVGAVIISLQFVKIKPGTSGKGQLLGGTAGGLIADNNSDNAGMVFAGVLLGALAGDAMEQTTYEATEYVIQTKNGSILTVVQANKNNLIFKENDKVILIHGYPSRLIKDVRK